MALKLQVMLDTVLCFYEKGVPIAVLQNLPFFLFFSNCRKQAGIQTHASIETFRYEKTFNLVLVCVFSIDNLKVDGNSPTDVQRNKY